MRLGPMLMLAPLLAIAVVMVAAGSTAWMLRSQAAEARGQFSHVVHVFKGLSAQQQRLGTVHARTYRTFTLIASLDETQVKAARTDLAQQMAGIRQALQGLATVDGAGEGTGSDADDAALRKLIADSGAVIEAYVKQADAAIDMASVDPNMGVAAMQNADASYEKLAGQIAGLVGQIETDSNELAAQAQQAERRTFLLASVVGLAAALGAVLAVLRLRRRVVGDLQRAQALSQAVAAGDLRESIASDQDDEVGDLMRSLADMRSRLLVLVDELKHSADRIQVSSTEFASGNQDLSSRTEVAASNLQQTASSMEQVNGNVRQTAEAARQAEQLASSATDVAQRGSEVVVQVVETMNGINSASSRIADIIGVIDGIAFQTNILALNAAVEAARAGEQGRGFAVVAGEVRALAQRSAQAAREIKTLIGASVDQVESGTRLVGDAGRTMTEIVASVRQVSDMIIRITAATAEQSDGIGKISESVTLLDHMTQQNAALVEQSAAAAESLQDQAQRLAGMVGSFRTEAQARGA